MSAGPAGARADGSGADEGEAGGRWQALQDELLRGLTHALSNRVATLSAAAYMLEYGDITPTQAAATVQVESERLDEVLQLLRRLPAREQAEPEPVAPADLVADAVALHAFHCDLRDVPVDIRVAPDVLPVLVEPHALRQALLLALSLAKRTTLDSACVEVAGDADTVRILVRATRGDSRAGPPDGAALEAAPDAAPDAAWPDGAAARELAAIRRCLAAVRGTVAPLDEAGGCAVHLLSLPAARRAGI